MKDPPRHIEPIRMSCAASTFVFGATADVSQYVQYMLDTAGRADEATVKRPTPVLTATNLVMPTNGLCTRSSLLVHKATRVYHYGAVIWFSCIPAEAERASYAAYWLSCATDHRILLDQPHPELRGSTCDDEH